MCVISRSRSVFLWLAIFFGSGTREVSVPHHDVFPTSRQPRTAWNGRRHSPARLGCATVSSAPLSKPTCAVEEWHHPCLTTRRMTASHTLLSMTYCRTELLVASFDKLTGEDNGPSHIRDGMPKCKYALIPTRIINLYK